MTVHINPRPMADTYFVLESTLDIVSSSLPINRLKTLGLSRAKSGT
jgi:hypothetical protein